MNLSTFSKALNKLTDKINMVPLWQWPLIIFAPAISSTLNLLIDPESIYLQMFYGVGSLFMLWAGPALFQKIFRFAAKVWKGKGMVHRDLDSGAKQCARIYLSRHRPNFLTAPLSFLFMKWHFMVGEIDINTGSLSVTPIFVSDLVKHEKQCRTIGTNDIITGAAAQHLLDLEEELNTKPADDMKDIDLKRLATINGLRESGLKIVEEERVFKAMEEDVPL